MPTVAFMTLGCKVNQNETDMMEGLFTTAGYTITDFQSFADVYVINTCSVTHLSEKKSRQLIRKAIKTNPAAVVAAAGCYAQVSPEQLEEISGVDIIVGTRERRRMVELVEDFMQKRSRINIVGDVMTDGEFEDIPLSQVPDRTRAFLKIQDGCTNFCTYCIIPYARGPLKSRPLASVQREAEKLVQAGFKEIVLSGIHLGAYGRDLGETVTLVDAVKTVLAVDGLTRLRLGSLESIEVETELIALMQTDERICRHLHLPLQAGSDRILAAMNRQYTTAEFADLLAGIRQQLPDIAITTDIIVGFPGETEELFQDSLAFAAQMQFARTHVFPYSKRKGTPAAEYLGQVPEAVKKERVQAMLDVAACSSAAYNRTFIGRTAAVLFEEQDTALVDGLTDTYIRVYADNNGLCSGRIVKVRLERVHDDGLWGQILEAE